MIVVTILAGTLTAYLLWHNQRPLPQEVHRPSEAAAKAAGFFSADDAVRSGEERRKYLAHEYSKGTLDSHDLEFVKETLSSGSEAAKIGVVLNLGALRDVRQQIAIVDFMVGRAINAKLHEDWSFTISQWAAHPDNRPTINALLASKNPELAIITRKVLDEQQKSKKL